MNRRYRRRWLLAFSGVHVIGVAMFVVCVWRVDYWPWQVLAAFTLAYFTGFWAAVLVEIATG